MSLAHLPRSSGARANVRNGKGIRLSPHLAVLCCRVDKTMAGRRDPPAEWKLLRDEVGKSLGALTAPQRAMTFQ